MIRVTIEHNDQSLEKEFDDTVALVAFLDIAGYYITRSGMDAMFKRFNKKADQIGPVLERRREVERVG